jgi:hypothetical protein
MKKIILSLLVAFCGLSASAQIVSSTSRSVSYTKHEKTTTWYGKVGLNVMNYVGKGTADGLQAKIGYDLNFGFQKPLGGNGLYWGMEFGLTSRGSKKSTDITARGVRSETELNEMRHAVVFSPFTFGYRKNLVNKLDIDAHVGIYGSCDYTGKNKLETSVTYGKETEKASADTKMSDWSDFNRGDVGLKFGVGLWWDRYNLDFSYRQGFLNVWTPDGADTNLSGNFIVSLGVSF